MNVLNDARDDEKKLVVYWSNGVIIEGFMDTISETSTCELEEDDPNYLEYYMGIMEISDIIELSEGATFKGEIGDLIELSVLNEPIRIEEKGKGIIWQKQR